MANVKTTIVQFQNTAFPPYAVTWKWPLATCYGGFAADTVYQFRTLRPSGVYSNLRAYVVTNTNSSTSTVRFDNNGSNSNLVLAIGTTQTGSFEDITHTDTVTAGNAGYMTLIVPSGSTGNVTFSLTQIDFLADSDTHTTLAAHGSGSLSTGNTTCYNWISGYLDATNTIETKAQTQFKHSCTLKNFRVYVSADSRTGNTTHRIRKNGGNGNQSIVTTNTGTFEDVTNTDTIVAGDKICFSSTTDATAGTHSWGNMGFDVENTTNSIFPFPSGSGSSQNFGSTSYEIPSLPIGTNTTEANAQVKLYNQSTLKNLGVNLYSNTINGTTTVRMRKNGNNANPVVSINASTSGFFSDDASTTGTAANDLVNFSVVTGGSSGSLTYGSLYVDVDVYVPPPLTFYSKSVSVLSTGGATQDITFTPNAGEPSWTPKVALVSWSRANTSADTFQEHASVGYGFTDGTNSRCIASATEDNQARADCARIQRDDALICTLNPTGTVETVDSIATFNSWLTNGIRINWTDAPAANFYINVLFLGGSDITNVSIGTLLTGTGTGDISVTSLAYKPDFGLFLSGGSATQNSPVVSEFMSIGAATSSSAQWVQSLYQLDNGATMATRQYYNHSNVVVSHTTAVDGLASFSSFEDTGFVLNVSDAFPASQAIYYLVIKGGSFAVGNATEIGSVTTQTITTSKDTKAVGIFGLDTGTANAPQAGMMWTSGFGDNALNQTCNVFEDINGAADSVVVSRHDTNQIYLNITANATAVSTTLDDEAALSAVSSTGFTLNWTNIGQARPFRYVAFGPKIPTTEVELTKTHKYNVIGKVTVNKTDKYNIIGKVTPSKTHKWHILIKLTTSKTHKFSTLKKVALTKTHKYSVIEKVLSTKTHKFSILYSVLLNRTHKYDITGTAIPVSTTKTHKYNVLISIATTKTHKYSLLFKLTNSKTHKYSILVSVPQSKTHKYNLIEKVTVSKTHKYNVQLALFPVSTTKTHKYHLVTRVETTKTHKYNIQAAATQVSTTKTHKFSIVTKVTNQKVHLYNISISVTAPKTHKYNILATVSTPKTHKYNVLEQITTTKTHKYIVSNAVSTTKTHKYNVVGRLIVPKTHKYDLLQRITKTKTHKYHIALAVFPVNTSKTHVYNVIAKVTTTKTHKFSLLNSVPPLAKTHVYNVIGKVTKSKTHKYNILVSIAAVAKTHKYNLLVAVSTTRTHKYSLLEYIIVTKTHRYNVPGEVTSTHTHLFDIAGVTSGLVATKTHKYSILTKTTTTKTHKYSIVNAVSKSTTYKYNIEGIITTSKTHIYNVIQKIFESKTHIYHILIRIAETPTKTHRYNILTSVTKSKTHKYNIIGRIIQTKTHLWNSGGIVSVTKTHRYHVGEGRVIGELGGSTNVLIQFPERVKIIDIIADIRNLAIANVEIFDSQVKPQNTAIGFVQLLEQDSRLPLSLRTASSHYQFRVASLLIVPEIEERIEHKAVSGRIGIEEIPLAPDRQFQTRSHISLYQKYPRIQLESSLQISPSDKTIINLASNTQIAKQTRIASMANLQLFESLNQITFKTQEIMTKEYAQTITKIIDILKNDDIFY